MRCAIPAILLACTSCTLQFNLCRPAIDPAPTIRSAPSQAGELPSRGTMFRDPTFGTCIRRITDYAEDEHDGFGAPGPVA